MDGSKDKCLSLFGQSIFCPSQQLNELSRHGLAFVLGECKCEDNRMLVF